MKLQLKDLLEVEGVDKKVLKRIVEHLKGTNKDIKQEEQLPDIEIDINQVYNLDNIIGMKLMIKQGLQVDSIVTDPPYNLAFMGKKWDKVGTPKQFEDWNKRWASLAYQILKPGGYLIVFGGTRTYHRMVSGVEDAGFEIKDTLEWIYGSGFPKSYNISKAFQKIAEGNPHGTSDPNSPNHGNYKTQKTEGKRDKEDKGQGYGSGGENWTINKGKKDKREFSDKKAKYWNGWGTALKPAHEPILLAQKPREGTYCENIEKYGCGGVNIDDCRVVTNEDLNGGAYSKNGNRSSLDGDMRDKKGKGMFAEGKTVEREFIQPKGRFPANILLTHHPDCECIGEKKVKGTKQRDKREDVDDKALYGNSRKSGLGGYADKDGLETVENWNCVEGCPIKALDEQSGVLKSPTTYERKSDGYNKNSYGDKGGASRYFNNFKWQDEDFFLYTAKASKSERTCEGNVENKHPTVKPIDLISWLVRLVTPKGGTVVDIFGGSGTTALSCIKEGMDYIIFEKESKYIDIIKGRIKYYKDLK